MIIMAQVEVCAPMEVLKPQTHDSVCHVMSPDLVKDDKSLKLARNGIFRETQDKLKDFLRYDTDISFAASLNAIGYGEVTHIFRRLLKIVSSFSETETQQKLLRALLHLSDGQSSNTRKLCVISPAAESFVDVIASDTDLLTPVHAAEYSDDTPTTRQFFTHLIELIITSEHSSQVQVSAQVVIQHFFHKSRVLSWLPKFLAAFDCTNNYMRALIRNEFPHFVSGVSPLLRMDDLNILGDCSSGLCGGPQLIHINIPVRIETWDDIGLPKLKQLLKYALGPVCIEILDTHTSSGTRATTPITSSNVNSFSNRLLGIEWECWKYELSFMATKFREQLLVHPRGGEEEYVAQLSHKYLQYLNTFSSSAACRQHAAGTDTSDIREQLMAHMMPPQFNFDPLDFSVGSQFVLKISISFKALGYVTVLPTVLFLRVSILDSNSLEVVLVDVGGGPAMSVVKYFFGNRMQQLVNSVRGIFSLVDRPSAPASASSSSLTQTHETRTQTKDLLQSPSNTQEVKVKGMDGVNAVVTQSHMSGVPLELSIPVVPSPPFEEFQQNGACLSPQQGNVCNNDSNSSDGGSSYTYEFGRLQILFTGSVQRTGVLFWVISKVWEMVAKSGAIIEILSLLAILLKGLLDDIEGFKVRKQESQVWKEVTAQMKDQDANLSFGDPGDARADEKSENYRVSDLEDVE